MRYQRVHSASSVLSSHLTFLVVMVFTSTEKIMLLFPFCLWLNNVIITASFNPCARSSLLHLTRPEEEMKMRMPRYKLSALSVNIHKCILPLKLEREVRTEWN